MKDRDIRAGLPPASVVLASTSSHGVHAARALHDAALLQLFIGPTIAAEPVRGPLGQFAFARRFNETRVFPAVEGLPVKRLIAGESMARLARRAPGLSYSTKVRWSLACVERATARAITDCRVFHWDSGSGFASAQKLKSRGTVLVCDRRGLHQAAYDAAQSRLAAAGVKYDAPESQIERKLTGEYDLADLIIVNSNLALESMMGCGVPRHKLHVLPLGTDTSRFSPIDIPRSDPPVVLFVGHVDFHKGVDTLARAMAHFQSARMRFVGACSPEMTARLRALLPSAEIVGTVPHSNLNIELNRASVLVLPSRADAFGLVAAEALAAGTPVIVSTACGSRDIVRPGQNGYVFQVDDEADLRDKLDRVLGASADTFPRRVVSSTVADLDWASYGRRLRELYMGPVTDVFLARAPT